MTLLIVFILFYQAGVQWPWWVLVGIFWLSRNLLLWEGRREAQRGLRDEFREALLMYREHVEASRSKIEENSEASSEQTP